MLVSLWKLWGRHNLGNSHWKVLTCGKMLFPRKISTELSVFKIVSFLIKMIFSTWKKKYAIQWIKWLLMVFTRARSYVLQPEPFFLVNSTVFLSLCVVSMCYGRRSGKSRLLNINYLQTSININPIFRRSLWRYSTYLVIFLYSLRI